MSNLSLYELTSEVEALTQMLEQDEGEVTTTSEQLEVYIQNLLVTKVEGCVAYIDQQEDLIKLAKEKIDRLRAFASSKENAIERFKGYILSCMDRMEVDELKGKINSIKKRKPSKICVIESEEKIPAIYKTIEVITKVDKMKLKKDMTDGTKIEGACLVDGKRSLIIK